MDPNSIIAPPREYDVWLAPDWSNWKPKDQKQPSGYTYASVRETRYADGRVVTEVLDENRQPITTRVLDSTPDKDQEKRFKEAQTAAAREQGAAERKVKSEYPGVFPPGHPLAGQPATVTEYESGEPKYVAIKPEAKQAGTTVAVEGTPDPSKPGGFDNERPRKVERGPNGEFLGAVPLSPAEMEAWRKERNIAAGGTGEPPKAPEVGKAYQNAQGQWVYPVTDAEGNITTRPLPPEAIPAAGGTKYSPAYKNKDGKQVQAITDAQGRATGAVELGTGAPADPTPYEKPEGPVATRAGQQGRPDVQYIPDPDNPGQVIAVPIRGTGTAAAPADALGWTPDPTKPGLGLIERAKDLAARRARGELDDQQIVDILTQDRANAELVQGQNRNILDVQQNIRQQDVGLSNAATGFSSSIFNTAAGATLTPAGMNTGGTGSAGMAFLAMLKLASDYARANGGLMPRDVMGPALQQTNQQGLIGAPPGFGGAPININIGAAPGTAPGATVAPSGGAPPVINPGLPAFMAPLSPSNGQPGPQAAPAAGLGVPDTGPAQLPGTPPAIAQAMFGPSGGARGEGGGVWGPPRDLGASGFSDDVLAASDAFDDDVKAKLGLGIVQQPGAPLSSGGMPYGSPFG